MTEFGLVRLLDRAAAAGYRLTAAGRQAFAYTTDANLVEIEQALDQGVTFDQIATEEWDGEPCFEAVRRPVPPS